MDRKKNEQFIIVLIVLSCLGLAVINYMLGWEFWVPPFMLVCVAALCIMHILDRPDYGFREVFYFIYAIFAVFYHGIHETSFFDVFVVSSLGLVAYSLLDHIYMMNCFLVEFIGLVVFQIINSLNSDYVELDSLNISKVILHLLIYIALYFTCVKSIQNRQEMNDIREDLEKNIKASNNDMDDFLSNISHELRTPVNVINGMSDLLIKQGVKEEAFAIREAGNRLTGQIDDIQDYTETRRGEVFLEEEDYAITSLINDVVTSFRMNKDGKNLEMVVDLSAHVPLMMRGDVKKLHKIFRHILSNSIKFTKKGGIFVKVFTEPKDYGVNLCIEITDTGIGMTRAAMASASKGMYQANKKRNRSSGGVGLGLSICYGFVRSMGGFIKLESECGNGTKVRITIPQKVVNPESCLKLNESFSGDLLFHVKSGKYKVPKIREFYRMMATDMASDINVPLYPAETVGDVKKLIDRLNVKYIFMGEEEYEESSAYFDELSKGDIVVAVSASDKFEPSTGSKVIVMPKPLYGYPVIKVLNEGKDAKAIELGDIFEKPDLKGIRVLVVDDEPMNLVVATGLFKDYGMIIDTAGSGREAIKKCEDNEYDIIFMDHMMPEMDGVETAKRIRDYQKTKGHKSAIVALTANVVSGAKEMFINEGFDGFVGKPINTNEFERVMARVVPALPSGKGGEA